MISGEINKSGETFLQTVLERSKQGVRLTVYANPRLEQFMSGINDGLDPIHTRLHGREWLFQNPAHGPAYNTPGEDFNGMKYTAGGRFAYRLDQLGKPLVYKDEASGMKIVNLSFLRLVGISEGSGISFEVKGVRTQDGIKELSGAIAQACKSFYEQYIRDVRQVATVSEVSVDVPQGGGI